jgi:hypothetical protein
MRGKDLATNLEFHYGLVNWFIGQNINARPTTRFIVPYLTAVGELRREAERIDLAHAWEAVCRRELRGWGAANAARAALHAVAQADAAAATPGALLEQPHLLSGWLSVHRDSYTVIDDRVCWNDNPIALLADLYHFLNMDYSRGAPAASMIWKHDHDVLQEGLDFYAQLCRDC